MGGSNPELSTEAVLQVFATVDDPHEPLTTPTVAERLDCSRRTAFNKLDALAEDGEVATKEIGPQAQVWWRPQSTTDQHSSEFSLNNQSTPALSQKDRSLLERILEASPISIVIVAPSGNILFANKRAEKTLGITRAEITSRTYQQPDWDIYYADGTPVPTAEHPITRVLETGEPNYGFEHWIELSDGTERWLSSNSAPILNKDGDVEYVSVAFEDATPLKLRQDKLTSDKERSLKLHSKELFQPFLEMAGDTVHIDVDEVVSFPDDTAVQYITSTGSSAKALVDVFARHSTVRDVRLLSSTPEHTRLEVHTNAPTVPLVFDALGGTVTSLIRGTDERPILTAELPGDVDPRTAIQAIQQIYPDVELLSQELKYTPRLLYSAVEEELTDRQHVALRTAYHAGYFKTPRTSTGDDLADKLGITRQTFNSHLRKAENAVLEQLFEVSAKGRH